MAPILHFRSLLLVEEKLQEAEYFTRRLAHRRGYEHRFELNAFLSAARSVTFLIQKEMSNVPGFSDWWNARRAEMREDKAMRFFLELRNYSQKEGRVAILGQWSTTGCWSLWFASGHTIVPECLRDVEVTDACRMHLARLARLTLQLADVFPAWSCPHRALTPEGVRILGIDLDDLDVALGYQRGFTSLETFSQVDRLHVLRRHFDGVDFDEIRRLSELQPRRRRISKEPHELFDSFGANLRARMQSPRDDADV